MKLESENLILCFSQFRPPSNSPCSRDLVQMMVNGVQVNEGVFNLADLGRNFGSYGLRDAEFEFAEEHVADCEGGCTLDLMVENLGKCCHE